MHGTQGRTHKEYRRAPLTLSNLNRYRRATGQSQGAFWGRFGVTQSAASRYENGCDMPVPTQLLLALHHLGRIDDADLIAAKDFLSRSSDQK